ncbi:protein DENND6A [Diaphorina citri]|uniref:Protein DENND6A n=1 Tax=Diaphorina citri TaxID=121845 RepID=A0A3Q0J0C1_DIACI|nr:protein DENND6A [Diaphorina citri]
MFLVISDPQTRPKPSLINPLIYFAEYRPYFTIHDSDFKDYTSKTTTVPPAILGVTNPFFTKTLQHWPHIIHLDKHVSDKILAKVLNTIMFIHLPHQNRRQQCDNQVLSYNEFLHNRSNLCLFQSPRPNPFDQEEFLLSLPDLLTSKIKGDWLNLYKRFFKSPNFIGWYDQKLKDIQQKLTELHLEKLSEEDFKVWVKDKKEVELIDMIMNIQNKLKEIFSNETNARKESVHRKLKDCICDIRNALPLDTQSFLKDVDGLE